MLGLRQSVDSLEGMNAQMAAHVQHFTNRQGRKAGEVLDAIEPLFRDCRHENAIPQQRRRRVGVERVETKDVRGFHVAPVAEVSRLPFVVRKKSATAATQRYGRNA